MALASIEEYLIPGSDPQLIQRYALLATRAKDALFGLDEDEVVVIDTETTGVNSQRDAIIEIAAARMKGPEILERFSTFVNPLRPLSKMISELTGIDDEMLADAPTIDTAMRELARFVGSSDLIAHNASFDQAFVMRQARQDELPGQWIDSLELARIALPRFKHHSLDILSEAFATARSTHRAIDDVEALCGVWRILLLALQDFPQGLLGFITQLRPQTPWPLRKVLLQVAGTLPQERFSLKINRAAVLEASKAKNKDDAEGCGQLFPQASEVVAGFSKDSVVGAMYPGYEPRDEQAVMAQEVAEAFATSTHRAIEAGTGVGKSIAYLLPAALCATKNNIGIGVATKTNALMDQLVYHELPLLKHNLPGGLSYVALKGYEHYPCLRKLERFAQVQTGENEEPAAELPTPAKTNTRFEAYDTDPAARAELIMLATLYSFIGQTSWGDLDAVNLYWKNLPKDKIVATPGDCIHNHCPFYPQKCLLHGLRQKAKSADIVVTNHALLFRDVMAEGGILPPIRHWIIDEAHSAEEEARRQLSPQIGAFDFQMALDRLYKTHSSVFASIKRKAARMDGGGLIIAAVQEATGQASSVDVIGESFFSFVKDLSSVAEQSSYEYVDIWANKHIRETGIWGSAATSGQSLAGRLKKLVEHCRNILSLLEASSAEVADLRADLLGMTGHLQEMHDALMLFLNGEDSAFVYSAQVCKTPDKPREVLTSSLYDVGDALVESFYPRVLSVIYTSATIATGESFSHFFHAVGLDQLPDDTYKSLRLKSSYDYDNNMTIYVPTDMPQPNAPEYLAALEELLIEVHRSMGGSTLSLFTNRREMEQLFASIEPQLSKEGMELICQTRGTSAKRLRDEFLVNEKTSLFALRSFWEGFDAPGATLRCVVIPRLPFSRPNDPLSCERAQREKNAWARYDLPEAIISLKQAAGRLIRSSTDTGYLVLADSRLVTKNYGKRFLQALPSNKLRLLKTEDVAAEIASLR